jgi:sulfite exporter TauE/SafE
MELWTAFLLGLVGSLHCAGMCGPLVLALPATGKTRASFILGRVTYNLGRIVTYCLLGTLFGLIGSTFAIAGLARWASIGAGAAILLGLAASSRYALNTPVAKVVGWLRLRLGYLLRQRTLTATCALGALNGLLPCGLVYVAYAGAVAVGGLLSGMQYMLAFGLGTVPLMLGLGLAGKPIQLAFRLNFQKLIPVCIFALGLLLILRGMSLGIPYVSPELGTAHGQSCPCH